MTDMKLWDRIKTETRRFPSYLDVAQRVHETSGHKCCSGCARPLEHTVVMSCGHHLCLACGAAELLRHKGKFYPALKCQRCSAVTMPHIDTIDLLSKTSPCAPSLASRRQADSENAGAKQTDPYKMSTSASERAFGAIAVPPFSTQSHGTTHNDTAPARTANFRLQQSHPSRNATSRRTTFHEPRSTDQKCAVHTSEAAQFFCEDCDNECVCGLCCIANGAHEGHVVRTPAESWSKISHRVRDAIQLVDKKLVTLSRLQEQLHQLRSEQVATVSQSKEHLDATFAKYKTFLQDKEVFYMKRIEEVQRMLEDCSANSLNGFDTQSKQLHQLLQTVGSALNLTDAGEICNWYTTNVTEHINALIRLGQVFPAETGQIEPTNEMVVYGQEVNEYLEALAQFRKFWQHTPSLLGSKL